ncbi:MAG: riboflavin synthase [Acidobacteriota bacterium]|nr:riboflavin synthase [Acidobacteriota bacterium]
MFTGIVEELGTVARAGSRLQIVCRAILTDLQEGASIAVNGVCLTAVRITPEAFGADLSPETLARTSLGNLARRSLVNLERSLALGDRLGGHIVQGHVDGTAEVVSLNPLSDGNWDLRVSIPPELGRYMIFKGSVAIDGVSLTIASLSEEALSVAIIPHTYRNTSMQTYQPRTRVNIEVDQIAKYIEKLMGPAAAGSR